MTADNRDFFYVAKEYVETSGPTVDLRRRMLAMLARMDDLKPEDKLANARDQAKAQFNSIKELIDAIHAAEESEDGTAPDPDYLPPAPAPPIDADNTLRDRIQERPLSVQIRSDWHSPGEQGEPAEYEILLCTGGPAVRIVGELDQYRQPDSAELEFQDWFTPWTPWRGEDIPDDYEETILEFARQFWFDE